MSVQDHALPVDRSAPCCEQHDDWVELCQHLIDRFPDVTTREVVEELSRCRKAIETFGLSDAEQLATGEVMARHGLLVAAGDVADVARLDPESHRRARVVSATARSGAL